MCTKFYFILLLFGLCSGLEFTGDSVNLNYCEIQKVFCKELDHVACFDEANLRKILGVNTDTTTCVKSFAEAIKHTRRMNGITNVQWNRELESFAMLTSDNNTRRCGVSVKYLDTKFVIAKQKQGQIYPTFDILDNSDFALNRLVTAMGCACKQISGEIFVYCWHNYSKRETSVKYENILNSAHSNTFTLFVIIFINVLNTGYAI